MSESSHERRRFWRLVGMALLGGAILTVINVLISREPSLVGWSNALCRSAMLLGIGSAVPFLFDAGRTFGVAGKLEGDADNRRAVWESRAGQEGEGHDGHLRHRAGRCSDRRGQPAGEPLVGDDAHPTDRRPSCRSGSTRYRRGSSTWTAR